MHDRSHIVIYITFLAHSHLKNTQVKMVNEAGVVGRGWMTQDRHKCMPRWVVSWKTYIVHAESSFERGRVVCADAGLKGLNCSYEFLGVM